MSLNFEKHAAEGNAFINLLAGKLGHEESKGQVVIALRAVLHTLRDSITFPEALNVLSQLPAFLKTIFVEHWKYMERPNRFDTIEAFTRAVEAEQKMHGEKDFNWNISTEQMVRTVFDCLGKYVSEGEFEDIAANWPPAIKDLVQIKVRA